MTTSDNTSQNIDPKTNLPHDAIRLLNEWNEQIEQQKQKHMNRSLLCKNAHYLLGVPATVFSAAFTSSSMANLSRCVDALCILQVVLGTIATALFGLLTFLELMSKSEKHKNTYGKLLALQRNIELILSTQNKTDPAEILNNVKELFNYISDDSPLVYIKPTPKISEHVMVELPRVHHQTPLTDSEKMASIRDLELEFQLERFNQNLV